MKIIAQMLKRSTLVHLRFLFSLFLLPIFFFALYAAPQVNVYNALMVLIVWHVLVYPASNGYNSYYDKDEGSIALVEVPPAVSKNLLYVSWVMDVMALLLAATVSWIFFISVLVYGTISKLYSHPQFRLKKYAISSFVVVAFFQGAFVCYSSILALANETDFVWNDDWTLISMISSCIIGASYPLTQIYQHEEDQRRGDRTLSIVLGKKGTFALSAILFSVAFSMLLKLFSENEQMNLFYLFMLCTSPVIVYFSYWLFRVWKNDAEANYKNTMQMTIISSSCMLLYFILINLL